jgi:hypothetical protein
MPAQTRTAGEGDRGGENERGAEGSAPLGKLA